MNFARIAFFATAFFFLSACGFKPVHSPNSFGNMGVSYKDISVRSANNKKLDFLLKQALRDRIGDHTKTRYVLSVLPKLRRTALGVSTDDIASRYDLVVNTKVRLIDTKINKTIYTYSVRSVSTYGAPRDPYGEISAESNATEQVATEAADQILLRLAHYKPGQ